MFSKFTQSAITALTLFIITSDALCRNRLSESDMLTDQNLSESYLYFSGTLNLNHLSGYGNYYNEAGLRLDGRVMSGRSVNADPDTVAPSIPAGFSSSDVTNTSATISWDASTDDTGVTGYRIFRDGSEVATTVLTIYTDHGLSDTTSYDYTVTAYDAAGNESEQSDPFTVITFDNPDKTAPSIPAGLNASDVTNTTATINWDPSTDNVGVTGYRIFRDGTEIGTSATTSYADDGLADTTSYDYTVTAYDDAGNESVQSDPLTLITFDNPDREAPSVPAGLSASGVTNTSATINWDASTDNVGVTGYRVFRDGSEITTITTTSYTDNGLADTTSYDYTITAYDEAGNESTQSDPLTVITFDNPDKEAPSVPTGLSFSAVTNTSATISWDASTDNVGVTGYRLFRDGTEIATSATTSYTDDALDDTTSYNYTVTAYDEAGNESIESDPLTVITFDNPDKVAPSVPTGLSASAVTNTSATISWDASTDNVGVTGYRILRDGSEIATTPLTSYTDDALTDTTSYEYTISAYDEAGNESSQSDTLTVITFDRPDKIPPSIPTGLVVLKREETRLTFTWNPSTDDYGVAGYTIYRDGGAYADTKDTLFIDFNLNEATTYVYSLTAFDNAGNHSARTTELSITTLGQADNEPPSIPTDLFLDRATATTIEIRWSSSGDNVGVTGYDVYCNGDKIATVSERKFVHTALTPSTLYRYNVRARDAAGNISDPSSNLEVTTLKAPDNNAPSIPEGLKVDDITEFTVTISWDESTDNTAVTGYRIFRNGSEISVTQNNSYTDSGLEPSTQYTYAISAFDASHNESDKSVVLRATTYELIDNEPPSIPTDLRLNSVTGSSVVIIWTASTDNKNIAGYYIYRDGIKLSASSKTMFSDEDITPSTIYKYTISAFDAVGNESSLSSELVVNTSHIFQDMVDPDRPESLKVEVVSNTSLKVTWPEAHDNIGIAGYQVYRDLELIDTVPENVYIDYNLIPYRQYFYFVRAFDYSGNLSIPSPIGSATTDVTLSTATQSMSETVRVFPVPAYDNIRVSSEYPIESVVILDISGRIINDFKSVSIPEITIDLSDLKAGLYLVLCRTDGVEQVIKVPVVR